MGTIRTMQMFGPHMRPDWAGPVTISDNDPFTLYDIAEATPRRVMGIIVPVTTKGRPSAPVPLSGFSTGMNWGTDKGHLMALDLGGPDISANIVPQTSLWQQSGGWRAVETNAQTLAMQWMGIGDVYEPGGDIPMPAAAAFLSVAPYSEVQVATGQPLQYIGTVTKVIPTGNGYNVHPDEETHIFQIEPDGTWWPRGAKAW